MKKFLPIILLCLGVLVCVAALTVDFSSIDIRLSVKKYHTCEVAGREIEFCGAFGKIHKIKIYDSGKHVYSSPFEASAKIFDNDENDAVSLCDINNDGIEDLLVLCGVDPDGDVHRRLFVGSGGGYVSIKDTDISNFKVEDGKIVSEDKDIRYLAETVEEYTVPYERYAERREYAFVDGEVVLWRKIRVSYYSESDIYCLGIWEYDEEAEEILCVGEDWLDAEDYAEKYEEISQMFDTVSP